MFAQNAPQGGPALINASGFVQAHGWSKMESPPPEISKHWGVFRY
jgi:hypothetical protein